MRRITVICLGLLIVATSGCARTFYANQCTKAGWTPGTQQHEECTQANIAADRAQSQQDMADILGAGALIGAGYLAAQAQTAVPAGQLTGPRDLLCPDGSYVFGWECVLAPNGVYVGGPAQLAPNGQYVGGYGRVLLCPDGNYVVGSRCVMLQDGRYVGY